jgi:hypothetical protein
MARRPYSTCAHRGLTYDSRERRIWCGDCETDVEPFDAFTLLVENMSTALSDLDRKEKQIEEAMNFQLVSVAAKTLDKAWRKRNMVPACPTCGHGLFPEQFKTISVSLGRDYAKAKLKRHNEEKP